MTPDRVHEAAVVAASLALLAGYELRLRQRALRKPHAVARVVHAHLRERWVHALGAHPGSELLAVQTVRNSLMSSTIVASTAALALTGAASLGVPLLERWLNAPAGPTVRAVLLMLLMVTLFASFVASALAMRLFNHAGYLVSYPVGSTDRALTDPIAADYLRRAGEHYSTSLRLLFLVAPLALGIAWPLLMPVGTAGLVAALTIFDRAPPRLGGSPSP